MHNMSTVQKDLNTPPHFALLLSAGMGHLAPFSRLAAALVDRGCTVSFIAAQPTVSNAESVVISHLLTSFPNHIRLLDFPLAELDLTQFPSDADPFYLRYEAIRRSPHLLSPLLSSSTPPISALVVDIGLSAAFVPLANRLRLPCYIFFPTSAAMLSLYAYLPTYFASKTSDAAGDIDVPGLWRVPKSSSLPGLDDPNHFVTAQILTNSRIFPKADGILVNTFEAMEGETLAALNAGRVVPDLPPVLAIGPLNPIRRSHHTRLPWLDSQLPRSVVYVSFGSRTAMTREQIRELGAGLEQSQCRFLWVIKTKKVDREEEEIELEELLGEGYINRVRGRGVVINGWVEQEEILRHRAVGLFVTHCGWNSVTEAVLLGVRVLAWPRGADQRVNGEVVRRCGVGVWMEEWCWESEGGVVVGGEIAKKLKEMMEDERVTVGDGKGVQVLGGNSASEKVWDEFIGRFRVLKDWI